MVVVEDMWLSKLIIINYRSCRLVQLDFQKDRPNIFIGINDCGKSTILLGVGLLLDSKAKFFFQSDDKKKCDLSNTRLPSDEVLQLFTENGWPTLPYDHQQCMVIGELLIEDGDVQDGLTNQLKWSVEYQEANKVTLAKVFSEEDQSIQTFLLTPDRMEEPSDLFAMTQAQLNKLKTNLQVQPDEIINDNQAGPAKKYEILRAIYNRYDDLRWQWIPYKPDNRDDRDFWPNYRYLDWNISLDELTQFANETLSDAIQSQLNEATQFANQQAISAQQIVNDKLETFSDLVTRDLPHIRKFKANIAFQVKSIVTDLLVDKENADGDVHLDSQGDGIKRQLWFALLKYRAMQTVEGLPNKRFIWCFDEPETHLYPRAQRDFFEIIKRISGGNVQSILSTHSTVFIDRANVSQITRTDLHEGYTIIARCNEVHDIYESLQIRNSDFLFYDRFLAVEGPTEFTLVKHLYKLHTGRTLLEDSIQLINLGGKSKWKQNLDILNGILSDFQRESADSIVTILDNDARRELTTYEEDNMNCYFVGKQDIEDAIYPSVWVAVAHSKYGEHIEVTEEEVEYLKKQIPKGNGVQESQKFYRRFSDLIRSKLLDSGQAELANAGIFPAKGEEWGSLLSEHITYRAQIPDMVATAFGKLLGA